MEILILNYWGDLEMSSAFCEFANLLAGNHKKTKVKILDPYNISRFRVNTIMIGGKHGAKN